MKIKLHTRHTQAAEALSLYQSILRHRHGARDTALEEERVRALEALGEAPDPDVVEAAMKGEGYASWTRVRCTLCGELRDRAAEVSCSNDDMVVLCVECVEKIRDVVLGKPYMVVYELTNEGASCRYPEVGCTFGLLDPLSEKSVEEAKNFVKGAVLHTIGDWTPVPNKIEFRLIDKREREAE